MVYKQHPGLTDYDAVSAVESLIEFYTAIEVYNEIKEMCDFRLGKNQPENIEPEETPVPISEYEILQCLKTIKSSINKWTKWNGRQGYLNFVKGYMPYI